MNKELEQAAERIALEHYPYHNPLYPDRLKEMRDTLIEIILTDPFILELVKDREKLETLYQFCLSQKMLILNACFYDETQKKFAKIMLDIERNRSAIEQGKKERYESI